MRTRSLSCKGLFKVRSNVQGCIANLVNRILESNLNAISRTPKLHRDEMLHFVHLPELIKLNYMPSGHETVVSRALESLGGIYQNLDLEEDPWVIKMKSDPSTLGSKALRKAMISHKT